MVDPVDPPEGRRFFADRLGRSGVVHHGATDMALLAPTPLSFGVVVAAIAPGAASAATVVPVSSAESDAAAPIYLRPSVPSTDVDATTGIRSADDGLVLAQGIGAFGSSNSEAQLDVAINGRSAVVAPSQLLANTGQPQTSQMHADADATISAGIASGPVGTSEAADTIRASVEALTGALEILASRFDVPAQQAVADVASTIDGLTNALVAQAGGLAASAGDTLAAIGSSATATLDAAGSQVDALLDQVGGLTGNLVAGLDATVGHVGAAAAAIIDETGATAGQLLGDADKAIVATAGAADAILTGADDIATGLLDDGYVNLAGVDPVGGLATLTDLLNASDGFEIVREGDVAPVFASVAAIPDVIDPVTSTVTLGLDGDDDGLLQTASDTLSPLLGGDKHGLGGLFDGDHDHG